MDIFLVVLGALCLLIGLAGAILPLPGPGLSFVGLLLLHLSGFGTLDSTYLIAFGALALLMAVLDIYLPVWGAKRFGGTRYGSVGAVVGLVAGLFLLPGIGLLLGTFLGALVGELLGGFPVNKAVRAAFGTFVGFMTGVVMQVMLCLAMIVFATISLWGSL
ncbi:hypothetical protein CLV98_101836 [Dyadobacter jejuensis]|uniref:DUF456 domain-containing protein n=1 Tax=Dyadobacter jejuensis TaxID=1082580 RepID=A0A316AT50_9BACT|nr:DUF456 domain-containing protein [Dyadobacter jejuensis]PWJ60651.1 hypothetical protein CLV98_101836 [Dyadobacter jejuensis]